MIKGILLDLDGLISDTEKLHMKAYQDAFREKGIEITDEKYSYHWIKSGLGVKDLINEKNLDLEVETMRDLKKKYYDKLLDTQLKPMPYATEFVKHFHEKLPMCVASGSLGKDVKKVLELLDLMKYLEFYLSHNDVENGKPHPEIWLKAVEKMKLKPQECIALEDAEKGIVAAYKANIPVIAIPTKYTKDNDFSLADYVVKDLNEAMGIIEKLRQKM